MLNNRSSHTPFILGVILLAAVGLKAVLLAVDAFPFNADEAIVALMARHILQGSKPIFFYGQAYMGSLDAYLVAGFFSVFGQQVWVIRLVQTILYLLTIISTYWIGKTIFHSKISGFIAAGLLAIPPVNTTLYTTVSLGGYGEALLIGNLLILLTWKLANHRFYVQGINGLIFNSALIGWGFLAGAGLWANGLTLIYSLPAGIILAAALIRRVDPKRLLLALGILTAGVFLGSLPWWLYAFQNGFQALIGELMGQAVAVEGGSLLERVGGHTLNYFLFGLPAALGFRPPWDVKWLAVPLLPFVFLVWVGVLVGWVGMLVGELKNRLAGGLITGVGIVFTLGFLFTSFGIDPSGRYFVPLSVMFAISAGVVLNRWISSNSRWIFAAILIFGFQLWGNIQTGLERPPGLTTQFYAPARINMLRIPDLITFLESENIQFGFTNYWVAYPVAFLTEEKIILAPRLPYHPDLRYTDRDDRYPAYTQLARGSARIAYITTGQSPLDERITAGFTAAGVGWQEKSIGDFNIYYDLSRPIQPEDLPIYLAK